MSEKLPKAVDELAAHLTASRVFSMHQAAAVFGALAEKRLIDPRRVFEFNEMFAKGFDQMSAAAADPREARAHALAAEWLREFEPMIRNMATVPRGAGYA